MGPYALVKTIRIDGGDDEKRKDMSRKQKEIKCGLGFIIEISILQIY